MDLRVKKTYRALTSACTKLLMERRFEEISVALLCEEAMIRRTTFYKHFADKGDFFSFYVEKLRDEMIERGRTMVAADEGGAQPASVERTAILYQLASYLLEHEQLMDNIFSSSMSGMMIEVVCDKTAESFRARALRDLDDPAREPDDLRLRCEFAAGGVMRGLLLWWGDPSRREDTDEFVRLAGDLASRVLD